MRDVVSEKDRSRNVFVLGFPEEDGEELNDKVSQVFQCIVQKPIIKTTRVGKNSMDAIRPVKVTLSSSVIVDQIVRVRHFPQFLGLKSMLVLVDLGELIMGILSFLKLDIVYFYL